VSSAGPRCSTQIVSTTCTGTLTTRRRRGRSLHHGDLTDGGALRRVLEQAAPDELYHLATQSHVAVSFHEPGYTADVVALGTLRLLEAVRGVSAAGGHDIRFYQAGSSEMFGAAHAPPNETMPFQPRSPLRLMGGI
jgi:GDPmannose 4,6-dehydratase